MSDVKQVGTESSCNEVESDESTKRGNIMTTDNIIGQQVEAGVGTNQGDSRENRTLRQMLREALAQVRLAGDSQLDSQISLGRYLVGFEIDFKRLRPLSDAFECLAKKAEEDPCLPDYTSRHFRNLAAFGSLYDEIRELLVSCAATAGRDADMPPEVSMTHYLATNKVRKEEDDRPANADMPRELSLDKKLELLRFTKKYFWSVSQLKERVNCELGIRKNDDKIIEAAVNTAKTVSKLTKLVAGNYSMTSSQLTAVWHLNNLIVAYGKALAEVVPEGMRDSVRKDADGGCGEAVRLPVHPEGGELTAPVAPTSVAAEAAKAA